MAIGSDEKSRDNPIRIAEKGNVSKDRPENKMNPEKPISAKDFFEKKDPDAPLTNRDLNRLSNISSAAKSKMNAAIHSASSCKPSSSALVVEERKTVERTSNVAKRFQNEDTVSPKPQSRLVKKKDLVDSEEEESAEETDSEDDESEGEDSDEEEEAEDTDEEEVKPKSMMIFCNENFGNLFK